MTEPKEAYITIEELKQAWKNWIYFHKGIECEEVETRFYMYCHTLEQSFIDDLLDWDANNDVKKMHVAKGTANRIKSAASTHFNTILNAYYIRNPWK